MTQEQAGLQGQDQYVDAACRHVHCLHTAEARELHTLRAKVQELEALHSLMAATIRQHLRADCPEELSDFDDAAITALLEARPI